MPPRRIGPRGHNRIALSVGRQLQRQIGCGCGKMALDRLVCARNGVADVGQGLAMDIKHRGLHPRLQQGVWPSADRLLHSHIKGAGGPSGPCPIQIQCDHPQ